MGKSKKKADSPNAPRTNKEERQLKRFYEPLILMDVLGSVREEHDVSKYFSPLDVLHLPIKDVRRQFLRDLCYMCDYEKGGDTVTAMGLEKTPQRCIFWVAANTCPIKKIIPFLRELLKYLQVVSRKQTVATDDMENFIVEMCVSFARRRIKDYHPLWRRVFDDCSRYLKSTKVNGWADIISRFEAFNDRKDNLVELCKYAYRTSHESYMRRITELGVAPSYKSSADAIHLKFQLARHYIGRLGYHIRAVKLLMASAPRLIRLLDEFDVRNITTPPKAAGLPAVDGKTRLDSIVVRMLPDKDPELAFYQSTLARMDAERGLTSRMLQKYRDPKHRPRVHSEVQVLEHFYAHSLSFEDDDRYIACSKPACYCCRLYFRHHPGQFVEPHSHGKLYISWRTSGFDLQPEDRMWKEHRTIMDKLTTDIRKDVLYQIKQQGSPRQWHPDSVTGITDSVESRPGISKDLQTILENFDHASSPSTTNDYSSDFVAQSTSRPMHSVVEYSTDDDSDEEGGVNLRTMILV